jgi:hypothetical protein
MFLLSLPFSSNCAMSVYLCISPSNWPCNAKPECRLIELNGTVLANAYIYIYIYIYIYYMEELIFCLNRF